MSIPVVRIIGGGLAGSEAAWQLASRGIRVILFEMRPERMTKAHRTGKLAELVCSNSFRGADLSNAVGLLKEELRLAKSLIMEAADVSRVPAGGALAVDREAFSSYIDERLRSHPLIEMQSGEVESLPESFDRGKPVIVATGPLTGKALAKDIERFLGQGRLAFFDAISPIILGSSINLEQVFRQSRYDKGDGDDYLNIPLDEEGYNRFVTDVLAAEKFGGHEEVESDSIDNLRPFDGCMPIEDMAQRGKDTLLFGPLKPVGLTNPKTGRRPHAVMQLRQDDREGTLWSMVGMQTRMKHPEQLRVFKSLPGLEDAEFVRLGSVHRNSFIDSPRCLAPTLELREHPGFFFAGQVTGVEGYVESTAAGLIAGLNAFRVVSGAEPIVVPAETATGGLLHYISDPERKNFQPMNISFGLIGGYDSAVRAKKTSKRDHRTAISQRALEVFGSFFRSASGDAQPSEATRATA